MLFANFAARHPRRPPACGSCSALRRKSFARDVRPELRTPGDSRSSRQRRESCPLCRKGYSWKRSQFLLCRRRLRISATPLGPFVVSSFAPLLKYMLDVKTGGNELRALLRHGPQESHSLLIDKRDLIEIDNTRSVVFGSMSLLPGSSQFANPQTD